MKSGFQYFKTFKSSDKSTDKIKQLEKRIKSIRKQRITYSYNSLPFSPNSIALDSVLLKSFLFKFANHRKMDVDLFRAHTHTFTLNCQFLTLKQHKRNQIQIYMYMLAHVIRSSCILNYPYFPMQQIKDNGKTSLIHFSLLF